MGGRVIELGFLGPQDLVYGFDPKDVVERLTLKNWRRKAVVRQDRHGLLYAWIVKSKTDEKGKKKVVYVVDVERLTGEGGGIMIAASTRR